MASEADIAAVAGKPSCLTCRHWDGVRTGKHRSLPGPMLDDHDKLRLEYARLCRRFPTYVERFADDRCGEYRLKEQSDGQG
jgi:hypothetical protein